ncbi:MAG: hypothetical protein EOP34_03210, partial [Rickettsiales bacterium]
MDRRMKKLFSSITKNKEIENYIGDSRKYNAQVSDKIYNYETFSDLLHYETFDEKYELFINQNSYGFMLETGLFIGSNESLERELDGLFQSILPENSSVQFLLIASPKVGSILEDWQNIRDQKSNYKLLIELAKKRTKFFENLASKNKVRDFRLYISYSINQKPDEFNLRQADILKNQIETVIRTTGNIARVCYPEDLINLTSEIINYNQNIDRTNHNWNRYQFLRDQIIDRSNLFEIGNKSIVKNNGEFEYRTYSVKKYPNNW